MAAESEESVRMLSVATLTLWLACLLIGLLGIWLPGREPLAKERPPAPVAAELVDVQNDNEPAPPKLASAAPDQPPPAPAEPQLPPDAPALPAVAAPSPMIAFAVPADVPPPPPAAPVIASTPQPQPKRAAAPQPQARGNRPAVERITFGQGEGRQPPPEYPPAAVASGQEGVVLVRFTIAGDGSVSSAEVAAGSRWPLLNQSALRTVRERWRFTPGRPRVAEVSIRFQLNQL